MKNDRELICAKCNLHVYVAPDLEFKEGDLCYLCISDEHTALKKELNQLKEELEIAIAAVRIYERMLGVLK